MRSHLACKVNTCALNMPMNEGTGHPHDSSGNGNNGTTTGAVWTHGTYGYGLYFDGIDDYVNCGNDSSLNITEEITIMAWANFDSIKDYNYIFSKSGDENAIRVDSVGTIACYIYDADADQANPWGSVSAIYVAGITAGSWNHYVLVYDVSDRTLRLFINGVQQSSITTTGGDGKIETPANQNTLVGAKTAGSYSTTGTITRPYIDTRAWTAAEILAEYNASKGAFGL